MELKEVKAGEYYYAEYKENYYVIIQAKNNDNFTDSCGIVPKKERYFKFNDWSCKNNIRLATKEEKHWLNYCIINNKFFSKETFLKEYIPEFIVGKWYKYDNWYIKYKETRSDGTFVSSEEIRYNRLYQKINSLFGKANNEKILLEDLKEIQDFLPQGHPNKVEQISEFKKGDYIVTLEGDFSMTNCAKINYCFKQRVNNKCIHPYCDLKNSSANGNTELKFDKSGKLKNWRYATPEEIAEYEKIGKPYDVTTLKESKELSLLEQAKLKYPIGTKYKGVTNKDKIWTITQEFYDKIRFDYLTKGSIDAVGWGYLKYRDTWAEIVEQPKQKELTIEEIQAECKRRFPVGCKFKSAGNGNLYTLNDVDDVYQIFQNRSSINGGVFQGYLYSNGKYAELVSLPEVEEENTLKYVECTYSEDYIFTKGKIYKTLEGTKIDRIFLLSDNGENKNNFTGYPLNGVIWKFKFSTKESYENQLKQQYPLTPEQCIKTFNETGYFIVSEPYTKNEKIEVGDEIEFLRSFDAKLKGYIGIVKQILGDTYSLDSYWINYTDKNKRGGGFRVNGNGYTINKDFKLIKKSNTITANTKVDVNSPKVTNKITVPIINTTSYDKQVYINVDTKKDGIIVPLLTITKKSIKNIQINNLKTLTI